MVQAVVPQRQLTVGRAGLVPGAAVAVAAVRATALAGLWVAQAALEVLVV